MATTAKERQETMRSGKAFDGKVGKTALVSCVAGIALSMTVQARTILWHHFDERAPGETAQAADVFVNAASSEYGSGEAHSINTGTTLGTDPDFMPTFAKPCYLEPIFDPVSGAVYTNTAAIGFHTAGTSSALAGGAVIIKNDPAFWLTNYTVECFVCTTGGTFDTIAPIVGKIYNGAFRSEAWEIGMLTNGKIFIRFNKNNSSTTGAGTHVITDGQWHHLALTCSYDETANKSIWRMYVDYKQDFETAYWTGPMNYTTAGNNNIYVGGYQDAGRKFNGKIDELRISDSALEPTQFLRRALPPFTDDDTLVWMPFDDEVGAAATRNPNRISGLSAQFVSRGDVATPVYSGDVPSSTLRDSFRLPSSWKNATSLFISTNGVSGNGTSVQLPSYAYFKTNLTVELFFKTAARVSGGEHQMLVKINDHPFLQIMLDSSHAGMIWMIYGNMYGSTVTGGTWTSANAVGSDLDDGNWHHLAAVYDADHSTLKLYIDYVLMTSINNVILSPNATECGIGSRPSPVNTSHYFHGWLDSVRFTKRALAPSEFLNITKRVVSDDVADLVFNASFDGDYEAQSGDVVIVGDAYSRGYEGCQEPTFSPEVRYPELLLDGEGGTCTKTNESSLYLNGSTVFFRSAPGLGAFDQTAEFYCKLSSLPGLAGIVRVNAVSGGIDYATPIWAFYADEGASPNLRFRCSTVTNGVVNAERYVTTGIPVSELVDDEWHHVAITLQAVEDNTNTRITVYIDGKQRWTGKLTGTLYSSNANGVAFGASARVTGNAVGYIDEFRILRGVQPPSRFLRRYRRPKGLIVRFR